jgi:hypothetical protein
VRWGLEPSPAKHQLKAGDEGRPWKTFSQLWAEHRYTRGALDKLVLAGQVPFLDGEDLLRFLIGMPGTPGIIDAAARLGGDLEAHLSSEAARLGILRLERYYDMQRFLAFSALDMLVPPPKPPGAGEEPDAGELHTSGYLAEERERLGRELGKTSLQSTQRVCEKCKAEIPTTYVYTPGVGQPQGPRSLSCPVCDATAHQLELLEQSRRG